MGKSSLPIREPDEKCNARVKHRAGYCLRPAGWGTDRPAGRCKYHGGKTLRGADHPNATHLRYSKYAPDKIVERYEEMASDPKLLTLREEIGLIRARVSELLENVRDRESGKLWQRLMSAVGDMRMARGRGDDAGLTAAVRKVEMLVETGFSTKEAWEELGSEIDRLGRMITLERRHIVAMRYLMTAEELGILFTQIIQVLNIRITDEATRRNVVRGLRGLLDQTGHQSV